MGVAAGDARRIGYLQPLTPDRFDGLIWMGEMVFSQYQEYDMNNKKKSLRP